MKGLIANRLARAAAAGVIAMNLGACVTNQNAASTIHAEAAQETITSGTIADGPFAGSPVLNFQDKNRQTYFQLIAVKVEPTPENRLYPYKSARDGRVSKVISAFSPIAQGRLPKGVNALVKARIIGADVLPVANETVLIAASPAQTVSRMDEALKIAERINAACLKDEGKTMTYLTQDWNRVNVTSLSDSEKKALLESVMGRIENSAAALRDGSSAKACALKL